MTYIDLLLLLIFVIGVSAIGLKRCRRYSSVYRGVDRDFTPSCALSVEHSPLLRLRHAAYTATPRYLVLDTETYCFIPSSRELPHPPHTLSPLLVSLSWILLDESGAVVRQEDHILLNNEAVSPEAFDYHGLSDDYIMGHGEPAHEVLSLLLQDLQQVKMIIGHFLPFHLSILRHDLALAGLDATPLEGIRHFCTMRQGAAFLSAHYLSNAYKDTISLHELYARLLWDRDHMEIISELKSRADCVLVTHCFNQLRSLQQTLSEDQ